MSTKSTVAHGDAFHLYRDTDEDGRFFLELRGVDFEASPGGVTVAIPEAVWLYLRRFGDIDLSPADETDEELRARAGSGVVDRMRHVDEVRAAGGDVGRAAFAGFAMYGPSDDPPADQVAYAFASLAGRREGYRRLAAEIRAIEEKGGRS